MEKESLVKKLKEQVEVTYEEAEEALKKSNWDTLDAVIYMEDNGIIKKPSVSTYFTTDYKESLGGEVEKEEFKYSKNRREKHIEGFFEKFCNFIDKGNNIFFTVKKDVKVLFKLPLTAVIPLIILTFWVSVPFIIVGFIFEFSFSLEGRNMDLSKANNIFIEIEREVKKLKEEIKKEFKK